ncbi:hypothetical protein BJ138DRAFT_1144798 [Hygrophoropsis aurantiaca]|uniref:Uncharacterized protein n=1 Tax=Hygrophoropsis aurantiaca TaxID=72124 RepID=A0ACB8ALZ5_9AGAM|nr:hypothetical protein BJ138DRAFT_1144798 [Hygrophoropsis aurantiaca]
MPDGHQPDKDVGPPFDAVDADITLRSSDGANFRTYKFILSFVSPVFRTMLSLPQPPDETATASSSPSTPPVVPVEENRHTLEKLLLPCYPGFGISLDTLDDLRAIMRAAEKYDMQSVLGSIRKWMVTSPLLQTNPLHFYLISCAQGWEAEARLSAAKAIEVVDFNRPVGAHHYIPEMEYASAGAYHRLIEYRARCGEAARNSFWHLDFYDRFWSKCNNPDCSKVEGGFSEPYSNEPLDIPKWFQTYCDNVREELFLRPYTSTLMNSNSFTAALIEGSSCYVCRSNLVKELPSIRDTLAEGVIHQVSREVLGFPSRTLKKSR